MQEVGLAPFPYSFLISVAWVCFFLFVGIVVRSAVPFCRKYQIPACMVGGLLGFVFMNAVPLDIFSFMKPEPKDLEFLVYHMFNLSFVCFGLAGFGSGVSSSPKKVMKGSAWIACTNLAMSNMQVLVAVFLLLGYNSVMGTNLFESAAQLLNQGFAGGPGAALSTGAIFEQAGIANMMSLGLAFAAMGFVFSILAGIPAANYVMRKTGRKVEGEVFSKEEEYGIYAPKNQPEAGKLRFMSSNVDTMSYQFILIIMTYALAYMLLMGIRALEIFPPQIMGILWSLFSFLFCLPLGIAVRSLLFKTPLGKMFDSGCHTRLLNIFIDLMALAALAGIQIQVLREWWIPMLLLSVVVSLATALFLWFNCRKLKDAPGEHFLAMLGAGTGTVTTGLVLVRMIDPNFDTTVPYEIGMCALPQVIFPLPFMVITMPMMYAQVFGTGTYWQMILACACMFLFFFVISKLPFWKMHAKTAAF